MKLHHAFLCFLMLAVLAPAANAVPGPGSSGGYSRVGGHLYTLDYYYDRNTGYYWGDGSAAIFEIWELGHRFEAGKLKFSILMDLPETGAIADDTYADDPRLSPADLWITVGSRNPFSTDPGVTRHAIALIDRNDLNHPDDYDPAYGGNVVRQKYTNGDAIVDPGEYWPQVTKGNLYLNADFATGSFETYQAFMTAGRFWYYPNDRDGDDNLNSYMTLIKDFDPLDEIVGRSSVTWTLEPYQYWDEDTQQWLWQDSYRITGYVDLAEIGLATWMPFSLFVSAECGNDGAEHHPPLAEPAAGTLLLLGLLAAQLRRR